MSYFQNKTVLLTGSNGGLGAEMARQLSDAGARLILTDIGNESIFSSPSVIAYFRADLSSLSDCTKLIESARGAAPSIDMLINNAGMATVGNFIDVPDEQWETLMQVNLVAPMKLTKLILPEMIQRKSGHIVNISSVGGHMALPTTAPYGASKFGLRGFGLALHGELKEYGIKVSNVYPSFTRTPILDSERFGYSQKKDLPDFLIDEVPDAVRKILKGIARGDLEVFSSPLAQTQASFARLFPGTMRLLMDQLLRIAN